jgi:hypothetical protein
MRALRFTLCLLFLASMPSFACGGKPEEGSLDDGEECSDGKYCKSGHCVWDGVSDTDLKFVCQAPCIPSGNACGPSGAANSSCCSGYCGDTGTCE